MSSKSKAPPLPRWNPSQLQAQRDAAATAAAQSPNVPAAGLPDAAVFAAGAGAIDPAACIGSAPAWACGCGDDLLGRSETLLASGVMDGGFVKDGGGSDSPGVCGDPCLSGDGRVGSESDLCAKGLRQQGWSFSSVVGVCCTHMTAAAHTIMGFMM